MRLLHSGFMWKSWCVCVCTVGLKRIWFQLSSSTNPIYLSEQVPSRSQMLFIWKKKSFYLCFFMRRHSRVLQNYWVIWALGQLLKMSSAVKWLPVGTDLEKSRSYSVDYHVIIYFPRLNIMKNMPQCLKSCQYFISDEGGLLLSRPL